MHLVSSSSVEIIYFWYKLHILFMSPKDVGRELDMWSNVRSYTKYKLIKWSKVPTQAWWWSNHLPMYMDIYYMSSSKPKRADTYEVRKRATSTYIRCIKQMFWGNLLAYVATTIIILPPFSKKFQNARDNYWTPFTYYSNNNYIKNSS